MMKNSDIEKFLNQYINSKSHPGYGVLISGEWGVGKTHFLNKLINSIDTPKKILYISLYGMSKTSSIDDEFFKILHPILGSKATKFAGRMAKLALKATLKVDLDGDKKDDLNINLQIPSIDLNELNNLNNNLIVMFDDLERSNIEYHALLGYINHLVEHEEIKVIIAGNESVIFENYNQYKSIKEKTIGKTFTISADYESALDSFISNVYTLTARDLLQERKFIMLDIFKASEHHNLRFLKQFLIEFELLLLTLENHLNSKDFIDSLLRQYLIYCIEYKCGNLQQDDFEKIDSIPFISDNNDTKIDSIREKYKHIEDFKYILDAYTWKNIVTYGLIDELNIIKQINESVFFTSNERKMPTWRMLWESRLLNDDDFDFAIQGATEILKNKKSTEIGEILHIAGSFIRFIEANVIDITIDDLESIAKVAIKETINKATYDFDTNSYSCGDDFMNSWHGHYYTNHEHPKLKKLIVLASDSLENKKTTERESYATSLFLYLNDEPEKFIREIYFNPQATTTLNESPFLNYISAKDFISKLIDLPPKTRSKLAAALSKRYAHGSSFRKLTDEKDWLLALDEETKIKIANSKSATKLFLIDFASHTISNSISQLDRAIDEFTKIAADYQAIDN